MAAKVNHQQQSIQFDSSRLSRARGLFIPGDSNDILVNSLEGLGAELSNRVGAIRNSPKLLPSMREYTARASTLSGVISYASDRLADVMARHHQIGWMRRTLAYEAAPDVFAQATDPKAASWRIFLGLAIKDFHLDISSLIDAIAPVVIQADGKLNSGDKVRLPGWEAIESGTQRNYREQLSPDIINIVDRTERWWSAIKVVRDLVAHRKHDRIVFGNPEDGLLFQIYDRARSPKILLPQVLYPKGYNVVDFDLYSAFICRTSAIMGHKQGQ